LALLLIIGCVVAAVGWGLRRVVRRPRPAGDPDTIAACDAVAASAAQAVVSAGGCVAFWSLAGMAPLTIDGTHPAATQARALIAVFAFALALALWAQRNRIERRAGPIA